MLQALLRHGLFVWMGKDFMAMSKGRRTLRVRRRKQTHRKAPARWENRDGRNSQTGFCAQTRIATCGHRVSRAENLRRAGGYPNNESNVPECARLLKAETNPSVLPNAHSQSGAVPHGGFHRAKRPPWESRRRTHPAGNRANRGSRRIRQVLAGRRAQPARPTRAWNHFPKGHVRAVPANRRRGDRKSVV